MILSLSISLSSVFRWRVVMSKISVSAPAIR